MPIIAETLRLIIRTFKPEEEDAYLALLHDERVREHLPKRTVDENRKIFHDTLQADAEGAIFSKWNISNKADGDFLGQGLLRVYNDEPDKLEVGYCIHTKYWGKGIATEMVKALINYASGYPDITTIVAVTTPGNIASQKVLERAGLINQGNIIRNEEKLVFFKMEF